MARNLVLCLDGTSNQYEANNTNVVKLYAMLDRAHTDQQIAYYQPGIGTMAPASVWGRIRRWIVKELDLAMALFLSRHVRNAYHYLMRYHQEGDRIYIFGFSRGAYTARAVAAMVHKVGLLTEGNEELIPCAWDMFAKQSDKTIAEGFKKTFSRDVPIHFLGLWDTVSSVGWVWDQKHLPFTQNNPSVKTVRHAVALDERRAYFVQNLWGTIPADLEQLWFPGVHCDVGGGYPEDRSGLSAIALKWMVEKAEAKELMIDQSMKAKVLPAQNVPGGYAAPFAGGPKTESLTGWWWMPEFFPKRYRDPAANFETKWMLHRGRHRRVAPDADIHASVRERMRRVQGYSPPNLPAP